ncbi:hypothetical protein D3C72_615230 [compost metagenome]
MVAVVVVAVLFAVFCLVFAPEVAPGVVLVVVLAVVLDAVVHPFGLARVLVLHAALPQEVEVFVQHVLACGFIPVRLGRLGLALVEQAVASGVEPVVLQCQAWLDCTHQAPGLVISVLVQALGGFYAGELARRVVVVLAFECIGLTDAWAVAVLAAQAR